VIDTVGKGDHTGSWETPAKASGHHRYERFHPEFIKFRSFLRLVDAWKLSGVGIFAEHGVNSLPFFIIFISVLVYVLDKNLILELFNLMLSPEHG